MAWATVQKTGENQSLKERIKRKQLGNLYNKVTPKKKNAEIKGTFAEQTYRFINIYPSIQQ